MAETLRTQLEDHLWQMGYNAQDGCIYVSLQTVLTAADAIEPTYSRARANGFQAGAAAMRKAVMALLEQRAQEWGDALFLAGYSRGLAEAIESLPLPEDTKGDRT